MRNGERIYFCVKDCKFRVHIDESLGKTVECWRCGKPFQITEYSKRLDKPHCNTCTKSGKPVWIEEPEHEQSNQTQGIPVTTGTRVSTGAASDLRQRLLQSIGSSVKSTVPIDTTKVDEDIL